ncbi:hypothetical protein GOBAR_DD16666 [Gossypium barbadense]|nr:hypothetical protein GOBAR_DD16666 [Gossypium barbadense]
MNTELYLRDLETFRVHEHVCHRLGLSPRSYTIDLRNRRCKCRLFQTFQYPCAHVHAACARANLDIKQFIDEVYILQRTLHILKVDHSRQGFKMAWMSGRRANLNSAQYAEHPATTDPLAHIVSMIPVNLLVMPNWKMSSDFLIFHDSINV